MKENRMLLKKLAANKIKDGRNRIILVTAVFLLLSYLVSTLILKLSGYADYAAEHLTMLQNALQQKGELHDIAYPQVQLVAFLLAAALMVLNTILSVGYEGYCLLSSRGKKAGVKNLFDGFGFFSRAFLITLIRGVLTVLGFMLFIIPGIIVRYVYSMSIFIMYDNPEMSAIECLRASRKLTAGRKTELFMLDLSLLGWVILDWFISAILLPIVQIFLEPYRGIVRAGYYNQYTGYVPTEEGFGDTRPQE